MQVIESPTLLISDAKPYSYFVVAFLFVIFASIWSPSKYAHLKDVPLVNPASSSFFYSTEAARRRFVYSSKQFLGGARKLYPHKAFRMLTDWGEVVILPSEFAQEVRNNPDLSFGLAVQQDNHAGIPGFETVKMVGRTDQLIQTVARKQLTKHLSAVIAPLSKECQYALNINFGDSTEWHEMGLKSAVLDIIARVSSRIYLGSQLCRNNDWLRVTKTYTTLFYTASVDLRMFPRPLRPLAHWFLPVCRQLRAEFEDAKTVIEPLVAGRRKLKQRATAEGKPIPKFNDALDWAEEEAKARGTTYNPAIFQLTLSLLAIHTTYDLLQQTMADLAQHSQFIQPIREEILGSLREHGWKKTALFNMKLLDSAIKESQRMKPGSIASMRRYVKKDTVLSNGLLIKKGSRLNVDSSRMMDSSIYADPEKYDAYRFYHLRTQTGWESQAHLVATSSDHLGFGHGEHSCPGRFFAANEIKVALCHILIKYEFKLAPNSTVTPDTRGMLSKASPTTRVLVRKRENVEMDIDAL